LFQIFGQKENPKQFQNRQPAIVSLRGESGEKKYDLISIDSD
jgi:hypothetical protein